MSSETPRTEAGRARLLPLLRDDALAGDVREAVRAIEDETWNAALTRVEEAVGGLDREQTTPVSQAPRGPVLRGKHESYQRVLRTIASLRKPEQPPAPEAE